MDKQRAQWGTRAGFIFAAVGSAIGLGNIWRFPSVAYENGGGAFFLPYLFALLTAGIPLLIMEFTIGQKLRSSAPLSFFKIRKGAEWLGWWQVIVAFIIATYYAVILAWSLSYAYFSLKSTWGDDTEGYLFNSFLKVLPGENAGAFGSIVPNVFFPLLIIWVLALIILFAGVKKGIERANRVFIPLLVLMFGIIVVRAVTLDNATAGLQAFFEPNWSQLTNGKVWVAAYSQIFFSLSIAFGIMITYASYLPKKTDITNNAFITGFANSSFELLAGIGVFATLGFMAGQIGVPVNEVVSGGIGLAFVVFPQIINEIPTWPNLFGFLFFASLFLAGMTSLISIAEVFISAVQEKFGITRNKAVAFGAGGAAVISVLYATQGGLYIFDTVDHFINQYGVALAGLVEIVFIAWIARELSNLQNHANSMSDIRLGVWWKVCLGLITPIVLGFMMIQTFTADIQNNYEGYPTSLIMTAGWGVSVAAILIGILFTRYKWKGIDTNTTYEKSSKGVAK
ncbi:sodium-dependent transporter [Pradoshia sp.]|uniref:sodium-dependent transporter n=1 Tax=Pradoshia sp. TaxID=2651281 RepID=UPI003F077624